VSEPTCTITITGITFWGMLAGFLLGGFLSPIVQVIGERIADAIRGSKSDDAAEEETLP
jgi:hypothetical protein